MRRVLAWCTVVTVAALCAVRFFRHRVPEPNVILITIDALRADHLGCYGYARATSPVIDAIAAKGILFSDAVSTASWTVPSIASLLSSTHPRLHGAMRPGVQIPPRLSLLPEILRDAGFLTAAFVNQPVLSIPDQGFARGFEFAGDTRGGVPDIRPPVQAPWPRRHATSIRKSAMDNKPPWWHHHYKYKRSYGVEYEWRNQPSGDRRLTDDVLGWLDSVQGKKFFLWIHYMNPHAPYTPPPPYDSLFKNSAPSSSLGQVPVGDAQCFGHIARPHAEIFSGSTDADGYVRRYDGEIRFVDDQLGRILSRLEERGLLSSSILVITADHGESMGEGNWYFEHAMPFEGIIRVPLIMRLPGIRGSRHIGALVSEVDIAPTILDALGIPPPPTFEGRSLFPLIRGDVETIREYVYGESNLMSQQYIRTPRYKLVVSKPRKTFRMKDCHRDHLRAHIGDADEVRQLFDIRADPDEEYNLAPQHPSIAGHLQTAINEHNSVEARKAEVLTAGAAEVPIDEQTRGVLRALGYMQ